MKTVETAVYGALLLACAVALAVFSRRSAGRMQLADASPQQTRDVTRVGRGSSAPWFLTLVVKWYRRAAERGDAKAQYILGAAHDRGAGVAQDDAEALRWYRKAAEQGHAAAQSKLDEMSAGPGGAED